MKKSTSVVAFVLPLVLLATLVFSSNVSAAPPVVGTTPNVIIILADDLGYGDLGYQGHPTIQSPNIDKMATNGMKFSQFYSGSAICTLSRAALLTGRLPIRTGVYTQSNWPEDLLFRVFYPWSTGSLPDTEITIAQALKVANYTSAIVGKWHLGHVKALPTLRGFDYFYGLPYSQDEGCPPGLGMPCDHHWQVIWPGVPLYENLEIIEQPVNLQTLVPRYTQQAISFMQNATNQGQPFFLYMAYDEVHVPLFTSPEFANATRRGLFGDAILEMDTSIGNLLQEIETLGISQNTFIFFTSDNGPWLDQQLNGGSAGLFYGEKGETWEGGFREPAIAYWPGVVAPGTISYQITSSMDLFPTVLDLAGIPLPDDRVIDGISLVPLLTQTNTSEFNRTCYFLYRQHTLQAARCGPYKAHYITRCGFCPDPPTVQNPPLLYDVEQDPGEKYPLNVTLPMYAAILESINQAVAEHNQNVVPGVPQLDPQDPLVAPCCNKEYVPGEECVCSQSDVNKDANVKKTELKLSVA